MLTENKKRGEKSPLRILLKPILQVFLFATIFLFSSPLNAYASVDLTTDEEIRIDQLYRSAQSAETRSEAIKELKAFIEDKKLAGRIRAYAVLKLGALNLTELEDYFLGIAQKQGMEGEQIPRSYAYLAYWKIKVSHESDPERQVALLVEALQARLQTHVATLVRSWATDELCNRGSKQAFPAIVESIKSLFGDLPEGEQEISFCRKRMDLLSTYPTRFEAFVAALKEGEPSESSIKLKRWAVSQLGSMKTEEANKILANYALDLQKAGVKVLEEDRPELRHYSSVHSYIVNVLTENGWSRQQIKTYGIKGTDIFRKPG